MQDKLKTSIIKLIRSDINSFQAYMYFNIDMMRSIFLVEVL